MMPTTSGRAVMRLASASMLLIALIASLVGFAPQAALALSTNPAVVISQVYGAGGNTGAVLRNDYVELFNRSSSSASLNGWSLQYASATGTGNFGSNPIVTLSGTLAPGQYYLVQLGSGGSNGTVLPTADATGTIAAAATAGKFALVSSTTGLACNGGSTPCDTTQTAQIIDLVGYGNANFFEGAGTAPTLNATTAALRADNGCTDTNSNSADFSVVAPTPRNTASPLNPCGGPPTDAPLSTTCPTALNTTLGTAASTNLQASDADDTVTGATLAVTPAAAGITLGALTPGNNVTVALNVAADVPVGSYNAAVTFTNGDGATASCTVAINVQPESIPIGAIQGSVTDTTNGDTFQSPRLGQTVRIQGVIYQRTLARTSAGALNYGFFIQNTAATADSDPNSSDGIFVFMSTFTSLIGGYVPQVGDEVVISGRVTEFFNLTQLSSASLVRLVRSDVALDAELPAFEVNPPDDFAESRRYWERREGMRALIPAGSLTVDGRDVFPGTADAEIWLMRGDHPVAQRSDPYARRVFRDFHPLDNVGPLGSFDDGNGYRFMIASYGVKAAANDSTILLPPARTFESLTNAPTGGVYYTFNKYAVMVAQQPEFTPGVDPALNNPPQAFNRAREYSVAPYNVENLYDYRDDPFDGCDFVGNPGCPGVSPPFDYVPASDAAYQARLDDFADQIIIDLHAPDILLIAEAEDQDICLVSGGALVCGSTDNADGKPDTLQELALRIAERGGPAYDAAFDRDGSDDRGIVAGFLYRTDRVTLVPADAADPILGSTPTVDYAGTALPYNTDVQNPKAFNADLPPGFTCGSSPVNCDGSDVFTRDPQVGRFLIYSRLASTGVPVELWAIANHFSSTPDARVNQRREQARYNAAIADAIQAAYPGALVVVGGDLNVYPRPDDPFAPGQPYGVSLVGPSDQLGPLYDQGLVNLFDNVLEQSPSAAYGYVFQGQTQTLDHIFTSPSLLARLVQVREAHVNADFAADYDGDGPRGLSDHDPQVARFLLDDTAPTTVATVSGATNPLCPSDCFQGSATVILSAADTQSGVATIQYSLNEGPYQTYDNNFVSFDITTEGVTVVDFFATDAAGNADAVQRILVKVTTFPSTGLLDTFSRPDGRLGASWTGATQPDQYKLVGGQVTVAKGGLATWRTAFGPSQEAFMRLTTLSPTSRHNTLALKARGTGGKNGVILVSYDAVGQQVTVEALVVGYGFRTVASFPATLEPGALLGARALSDGTVRVYADCMPLGTADTRAVAGRAYVDQGGNIGVWLHDAADAVFDDFGGGNLP